MDRSAEPCGESGPARDGYSDGIAMHSGELFAARGLGRVNSVLNGPVFAIHDLPKGAVPDAVKALSS
mgnify:CR=1 FL=1